MRVDGFAVGQGDAATLGLATFPPDLTLVLAIVPFDLLSLELVQ